MVPSLLQALCQHTSSPLKSYYICWGLRINFPCVSSGPPTQYGLSSDWYWLIILNLGWNFLVCAKWLAAFTREEIFIFLRANDLSPGPTHWWLFTRAQMLGLKMSGNVSGRHPSSGRPWLNPSDPIDIDSVTFKTITFHRPRWSPHHRFRADSWLATNYWQEKALTPSARGWRACMWVCVCVCVCVRV